MRCGAISESVVTHIHNVLYEEEGSRACLDGLNWQPFSRRRDQRLRRVIAVGRCVAMPPYWPRPSGISNDPRDNMQVKLTNDVAKGADIDLVCLSLRLEEARSATCFVHQLRLIGQLKMNQLDHVFKPRHENEPWPAGVVHEQHAA